jgi:hypothetical protein
MSDAHTPEPPQKDPIEAIVPYIPVVLPVVGGIIMFLLAFIAVFMA